MATFARQEGTPPPIIEMKRVRYDTKAALNESQQALFSGKNLGEGSPPMVVHRCGLTVHKWWWKGESYRFAFDYESSQLFAWEADSLSDEELQELAEAFEDLTLVPPTWP